jgi:hypothetical protein
VQLDRPVAGENVGVVDRHVVGHRATIGEGRAKIEGLAARARRALLGGGFALGRVGP